MINVEVIRGRSMIDQERSQQSTFTIFHVLFKRFFTKKLYINLPSVLFSANILQISQRKLKHCVPEAHWWWRKGLPMMHLAIPTMPFASTMSITSTWIVDHLYIDH